MAWITGNGNSVGPGIMSTGRVWHWAQLIVTSDSFVAGALRPAQAAGGLRQARPAPTTPEHPGSGASRLRLRPNIRDQARPGSDYARTSGIRREPAPARPNIPSDPPCATPRRRNTAAF